MRKTKDFSMNVGISSILFIFVVLALVSFAILSLSSATGDYKLSERVAQNTESYYTACNEAMELLESFDGTLSDLYKAGISRAGYYEQVGKKKAFAVTVNELQTLEIEVEILYPEKAGDCFYEITKWQVETTGTIEYDDSLKVFK